MAYTNLKQEIDNYVYENHENEILGKNLQKVLKDMVDVLGDGYRFMGVARTNTTIPTPEEQVFYLVGNGEYGNFGSTKTVPLGYIGVMYYDTQWNMSLINLNLNALNLCYYEGGSSIFSNRGLARQSVPTDLRHKGLIISYVANGIQYCELCINSASATWGDDASWYQIYPFNSVSVSQNTNTGHIDIEVGGEKNVAASVLDIDKIIGANKIDNIVVTQGAEFRHEIVVQGLGDKFRFTFTGMSLFDDVVVIYDSTLSTVLLEIDQDGTYEVNIADANGEIVFFRNADHVVSSGTVTIAYEISGIIDNKVQAAVDEVVGISNVASIPVTQGVAFQYEVITGTLTGDFKFSFEGKSLFGDVVAVYTNNLATPSLEITTDGDYNVTLNPSFGKVIFFRNAPMVTSSGTVTIAYEANGIIDNKVQAAVDEVVGISDVASIPVTQGVMFQYGIDVQGLSGNLKFTFTGMSLFDDVVVIYDSTLSTVLLEIDQDGTYEVNIADANGEIVFFRNAAMVSSSGTVTIAYKAGGIIDDMIDGTEGNVIRTDDFMNGVTKNQKYLTRIAFLGDSLTANEVGGDIPQAVDEGNTMRPMRLLYNNIPRRFYDKASWNKPIFRRLDNTDFIINDFSEIDQNSEPMFWGVQEKYWTASSASAYAEITIPNGYEHFAIIARTKSGYGKLNVTINGGNPASLSYSNPIIDDDAVTGAINGNPKSTLIYKLENNTNVDENDCPITLPVGANQIDLGIGVGQGNPYAIFEYNNLPSGSNTIRISANDATRVDLWGIFYWTGNSMIVMNMAYGGHSTTQLLSVYRDVVFNDDVKFDSYIFEIPLMNDTAKIMDVSLTKTNVNTILNKLKGKDVLFTSCHPFGLSIVHDTNFYAEYSNPTMEQVSEGVRSVLISERKPYIDLFRIFKALILSRGGTLAGGEGGLWYTWDGQHENLAGIEIWFNNLWSVLKDKPLMID